MNVTSRGYIRLSGPIRVYLTVLAIIFVSEFLVMLLLPVLLPANLHRWWIATADASLLTMLLLPFLWLTVIRPLRVVVSIRADLLDQFVRQQEDERRRIARDLHDEIGATLASIQIGLQTLSGDFDSEPAGQQLADLRGNVVQATKEVRRIANGLRPAALDHLGLISAVEHLAEDFGETHDTNVTVVAEIEHAGRLAETLETAIYRIVQEALTNAARHANPKHVQISLRTQKATLLLEVEDDGKGFANRSAPRAATVRQHLGLAGMAERTALLDGTFAIDTNRGQGTKIRVTLPLQGHTK